MVCLVGEGYFEGLGGGVAMVCERYGNHKGVVECGRISLDRDIVRATCRGEGRGRGERGEGERKGGGGERVRGE